MTFVPMKQVRRRSDPLPDAKRPAVLYVEDEDVNWEIAEHNLESHYAIARACNAREAFERIAGDAYDVILMDIQLSGSDLNGLDIARILKGRFRGAVPRYATGVCAIDTPIVFVTAYTARYKKSDILEAGGEALIPKPVNFTLLAIVMASLFAGQGNAPPHRRGSSEGGGHVC